MSYIQSNAIVNILNTGLTATTTVYSVSPGDSGKIMMLNLNSAAGGTALLDVRLPSAPLSMGLRYKFIVASGTPITTNSILIGSFNTATPPVRETLLRSVSLANSAATATGGSPTNLGTFTLVPITGGATGVRSGDSFDICCDGTNWYILANTRDAAACTIA